ncbi:hypothetical protein VUR80DRAFT_7266 [Thermomyces stellatus]
MATNNMETEALPRWYRKRFVTNSALEPRAGTNNHLISLGGTYRRKGRGVCPSRSGLGHDGRLCTGCPRPFRLQAVVSLRYWYLSTYSLLSRLGWRPLNPEDEHGHHR